MDVSYRFFYLVLLLFCAVNVVKFVAIYNFYPLIFVNILATDFVYILFNMQDSQVDQPLADETFLSKIYLSSYLSIYLST